jgi:hypothetical protein
VSPEHLTAWIGLPTAATALVVGVFRASRKAFRTLDRLEGALKTVEGRSVQLEHNGGSSMRDDAKAARTAAEAALAVVTRVEERVDRHLEQHALSSVPSRRRT